MTVGDGSGSRRRSTSLISSSTTTMVDAMPTQIAHCAKLRSTVPAIRCKNGIVVIAMIASSANP